MNIKDRIEYWRQRGKFYLRTFAEFTLKYTPQKAVATKPNKGNWFLSIGMFIAMVVLLMQHNWLYGIVCAFVSAASMMGFILQSEYYEMEQEKNKTA